MPTTPWFRRRPSELRREQDLLLKEWIKREVIPFSPFWAERLRPMGAAVSGVSSLQVVNVAEEADIAGAGGPGNPDLVLSPSERAFKRHAPRRELLAAARQAGGKGTTGRRDAIWHRYKVVHVHEAGVDRLLAIAYTRADLDRLHLAGARLAEIMGWGAEDALLNLVPAGPSVRFWALYHAALATRMSALHPRGAGQSVMAPARRGLALLPASVITVPVEEAESVIDGLVGAGIDAPNLRLVVPVGPPPGAETRIRLTEVAERLAGRPVRVQAAWAPEVSRVLYGEAPVAANDPPEATYGLVTYPDLELLQVRDADSGQIVTDGGPGELVITSLGWRGTALVRVATGAWVEGLEDGSPQPVTGATVPRLAPAAIDGAWQPQVRDRTGLRRVDLRRARPVVEPALQGAGVTDFALVPEDRALVLRAHVPEGGELGPIHDLLVRLEGRVGVRPELRLGPVPRELRGMVGRVPPPR